MIYIIKNTKKGMSKIVFKIPMLVDKLKKLKKYWSHCQAHLSSPSIITNPKSQLMEEGFFSPVK